MKPLVVLLSCTTLLFGGSTVYLSAVLQSHSQRRAQPEAEAVRPRPRGFGLLPWTSNARRQQAASEDTLAITATRNEAVRLAVARHRLEELNDPARRAERGSTIRTMLLPDYASLARSILLPAQDVDRLVDTMAELLLRRMSLRLECEVNPLCDLRAYHEAHKGDQQRDIATALGPQMFARYTRLNEAHSERVRLFELDARLPTRSKLTDAATYELALALHEERMAFIEQAGRNGEKLDDRVGATLSAARPGASDANAQRLRSAADYSQRIRRRAAELLTPDQLAAFDALQKEQLLRYTEDLRNTEIAEAARQAAASR